jgi:sortase family protein
MNRPPVTAWRRFLVLSPVVVLALTAGALGHLRTGAESQMAVRPTSATAAPGIGTASRAIAVSPRPGLPPRKVPHPLPTRTVKGPSISERPGPHMLPPTDLSTSVEKAAAPAPTTPRDTPTAIKPSSPTARSRVSSASSHVRTIDSAPLLTTVPTSPPTPHAPPTTPRLVPGLPVPQGAGAAPGIPMRLRVPALDIDARVESVGLSGDAMDVPADPWDVAWFNLGPRPGIAGNSVIDGHLDTATGPAIFLHLGGLRAGDLLYVTDNIGVKRTFRVTALVSYPWDRAPLTRIFGPSTGSHLNLITCDGTWLPQQGIYNERLVVYSTLVR